MSERLTAATAIEGDHVVASWPTEFVATGQPTGKAPTFTGRVKWVTNRYCHIRQADGTIIAIPWADATVALADITTGATT